MALLPPDPVFVLRAAEMSPIHSLCFYCTKDSQRLLAGTQDGQVFTWNLQTNRLQDKFACGDTAIMKVHHCADELFTQDKGGGVKLWKRAEAGYVLDKSLPSEYCGFCRFYVAEGDDIVLCPERDSKIGVFTRAGEKTYVLDAPPRAEHKLGEVMCFKYLKFANPCVLAAYESGDLYLWDLTARDTVSHLKLREFPVALDYDQTFGRGVYGNASDKIQVFSIGRDDSKLSLKCDIVIKNPGVNTLKIRDDRKIFVAGCWDSRLRVYSWKSLRPLAALTEHKGAVQDVSFSNVSVSMWNAPIMAAGGMDCCISLWDIYK